MTPVLPALERTRLALCQWREYVELFSTKPDTVRDKYGRGTEYLIARRLVEAGVPVVTLTPRNHNPGPMCNGEWDHHDHIFRCLRSVRLR